jgi:tetratricopeptide (TPR) repeat protein
LQLESTTLDHESTLSAALLAESERRWADSFSLCQKLLEVAPSHLDALNLLGRIFLERKDGGLAIGLQCVVLRLAPYHPRASRDLAIARGRIRSAEAAEGMYRSALALEPDIACHHRCYGSAQPFVGMDHVEGIVRTMLDLDPSHAKAHAALGNILSRRGHQSAATFETGSQSCSTGGMQTLT